MKGMRVLVLAMFAVLGGCAQLEGQPSYLEARLNDLADAVPFSLAGGPGVLASVRMPFFSDGIGLTKGVKRFGWPGRRTSRIRIGDWGEWEFGGLIGAVRSSSAVGYDVVYVPFGPYRGEHSRGGVEWPALLDVEGTAHFGLLGVRAGVSPIQVVDFVLGWFGIDLVGDDSIAVDTRGFKRATRPDAK